MKKPAKSKARSKTKAQVVKSRPASAKARKAKAETFKAKVSKAKAPKAKATKTKPLPRKDRRPAEDRLAELKRRLLEISDLGSVGAVLGWDEATYMPTGGAAARGRQSAALSRMRHERSIDPALGTLIDSLAPHAETLRPDSDDAALIRVARRNFGKAIKVPADWVERSSVHGSASYDAWTRARPANDFATMRPYLEKTIDLSREYAGFFAPYDRIADPLIDDADHGMTTALIQKLFTELRRELVPIVRAIAAEPVADDRCLHGAFGETAQLAFGLDVVSRLGYDLSRGRLDKTHHPFCTRFGSGDVRITTRVREDDLGDALFSTVHESGHAMYEQGVSAALDGTPLGSGVSAGVHESQSRLWENVVGRGRGFWEHFYPALRRVYPGQFDTVPLDTFYRAINKVERSLIRTDADEVTYNLHVMLRFDLELDLLEGRLAVKDIPDAWRARMQADLGLAPPDDRNGCLQDVHWYYGGLGGAFQGYTIGNILSAQFYAAAVKANPGIPSEIAAGEFGTLHGWLTDNLYRHGAKFTPNDLIKRATGEPMTMRPYLAYLRGKYGELYSLPAAA
ncbi:MAG TPA: carboxypeptidase M32 [Xanthobacteraceae bacterium]|nr:carboxypeptidase M32 [Xanthobacteraceae bacterium]